MEFIISHHSCDIKVPVVYFSDTTYFVAHSLNQCHQKVDTVEKIVMPLMTFVYCIRSSGVVPKDNITQILDFTLGQKRSGSGSGSGSESWSRRDDGNYLFFKFLYDNLLNHSLLKTNVGYDDARRIIGQVIYDYEHIDVGDGDGDGDRDGDGDGDGDGDRDGDGDGDRDGDRDGDGDMKMIGYKLSDEDIYPPIIRVYYENGRMGKMNFHKFMSIKPDDLVINGDLQPFIAQMEKLGHNYGMRAGMGMGMGARMGAEVGGEGRGAEVGGEGGEQEWNKKI